MDPARSDVPGQTFTSLPQLKANDVPIFQLPIIPARIDPLIPDASDRIDFLELEKFEGPQRRDGYHGHHHHKHDHHHGHEHKEVCQPNNLKKKQISIGYFYVILCFIFFFQGSSSQAWTRA